MNKKIYILFALTAGLFISVHASENVNTTENRQFLKQQETLSQQLREKPDTQLQAWAEQQVRANPLQHSDNQFLDELVRKQQASQDGKPRQCPVFCVVFHSRRGAETNAGRNPALRYSRHAAGHGEQRPEGHADAVLSLVKDGATDGVQIDRRCFHSTAFAAFRPWWCSAARGTTSSGEICASGRRWRKWPPQETAGRWLRDCWTAPGISRNEFTCRLLPD